MRDLLFFPVFPYSFIDVVTEAAEAFHRAALKRLRACSHYLRIGGTSMRKSRWMLFVFSAALILAVTWIAAQPVTAPPQRDLFSPPEIDQRRVALDANERRRLETAVRLEFSPQILHLCFRPVPTPAAAIDPHRSLFVHDRSTLDAADFTLNRTLTQIANQVAPSVPGTTATSIFRQLWDTQNPAPGVTSGPHCSDNGGTINGFPITCPRNEGSEAIGSDADLQSRMKDYAVLALVNRLDLAHTGWRNCGEHRIIYGKRAKGRAKNLIIFEAVLPNPRPGCREGCVPVAEFWKSLSSINDPATRANALARFYYNGLPGFRPVVHVNHYSVNGVSTGYGGSGSGQIRTNQFLQSGPFNPWLLKEFKTVIDCASGPCEFNIVPVMVKVNPHGPLWNEDDPTPIGATFRADTAAQLPRLSTGDMMKIGYEVNLKADAGQSMSLPGIGFVDNYRQQMNAAASTGFRAALGAGSLTADQIANRALTQSCAGCHQPSTFGINLPGSIGTVMAPAGSPVVTTDRWPDSVPAGFVHVDTLPASSLPELAANPAAFPSALGQVISPALLDFFLPDRKNFLLKQLNDARCNCVNRFHFLDAARRPLALEIQARIHKPFEERLRSIEEKLAQLEGTGEKSESAEPLLLSGPERDERRAVIEAALARLPEEQRTVLVLKVWAGLTFPQIGAALDIPANTAASRHRYALLRLRELLAEANVP